MSGDDKKPKIAVLEDEPEREQPDLDPPPSAADEIKRGGSTLVIVGLVFGLVFVCGMVPTVWMLWPEPEVRGGTIAVLPLVVQSEVDGYDPLGEVLSEQLIAELSKEELLQVTPKSKSLSVEIGEKDYATVGKELGVTYVVAGQVLMRDENEQATLQLSLVNADVGGAVFTDERFSTPVASVEGFTPPEPEEEGDSDEDEGDKPEAGAELEEEEDEPEARGRPVVEDVVEKIREATNAIPPEGAE